MKITHTFNGIYNLNKRLREIDKNYKLVLNMKTKRLELYSIRGIAKQKELEFEPCQMSKIISRVRLTRRENIAKIIKNMEKSNQKLEENAFFEKLDKSKQISRELVSYADKRGCDLSEKDMQKIING